MDGRKMPIIGYVVTRNTIAASDTFYTKKEAENVRDHLKVLYPDSIVRIVPVRETRPLRVTDFSMSYNEAMRRKS